MQVNGPRLLGDLRRLAEFGKVGTGVDRIALSAPDIAARAWLRGRMAESGLDARIDAVGNVWGGFPNAARTVVIGSHTDSVPKGGWLDGALGVLYGLEIARVFRESGKSGLGVDVISFQDEEGTFLPCVGSRSFCNDVAAQEIAAARSRDGRSLSEALAEAGYRAAPARLDRGRHIAYLEAHIEQGPRLEAERRRIGVVTGIVGIRRYSIRAVGQADHAGTTPMAMRKDAARALFALAHRIASEFAAAGSSDTVWNIGRMEVKPGAANVVPSEAVMTFEFRDTDAAVLTRLESWLAEAVASWNGASVVKVEAEATAKIAPTAMTPSLGKLIDAAARASDQDPLWMPSGAGHDAMIVGRFLPSAMLFIPSIGGRSHDIVEDTSEDDIVLGCQVLCDTVAKIADGAAVS